jgi:vacuolar-type H+-ATPase subunit F/Vma7
MNGISLRVIGDENAVFGFALLGVPGEIVRTPAEARQALRTVVAAGNYPGDCRMGRDDA